MFIYRLMIGLVLIAGLAGNVFARESCDLAGELTEKAVTAFASDQEKGITLFIAARELCPEDPAYPYNLAIAYYRNGRLDKAHRLLEETTRIENCPAAAFNNLAQVIIDRHGDGGDALYYAEQAVMLDDSPATQDTLARARFSAGQKVQALEGLYQALSSFKDEQLQSSYNAMLDLYLASRLKKIVSEKQNQAKKPAASQ